MIDRIEVQRTIKENAIILSEKTWNYINKEKNKTYSSTFSQNQLIIETKEIEKSSQSDSFSTVLDFYKEKYFTIYINGHKFNANLGDFLILDEFTRQYFYCDNSIFYKNYKLI